MSVGRSGGWAWRWLAIKWWRGPVAFVVRLGSVHGWHLHLGIHRPRKMSVQREDGLA